MVAVTHAFYYATVVAQWHGHTCTGNNDNATSHNPMEYRGGCLRIQHRCRRGYVISSNNSFRSV